MTSIRPFTVSDYESVIDAKLFADVVHNKAQWQNLIRIWDQAAKEGSGYIFAVIFEEKIVGKVTIYSVKKPPHSSAKVGGELVRSYQWKGITTEVGKLVIDFCFNQLRLNRISGVMSQEQLASKRIARRFGAKFDSLVPSYGDTKPSEQWILINPNRKLFF